MIKFYFKLDGYIKKKISRDIKRIEVIDRIKLQDGIDTFQKELDWPEMWSVDDAEKRIKDGWWFYVIEIGDKYVGWCWFDNDTKKFCNSYVEENYRNNGYGKDLVYVRLNECKRQGIENVWMEVEEWNAPIQKISQRIGWSPKVHYTFWTGGYDSTYLVCKFLLEGKLVQPIYIDDRVDHGGYHSNPLIKQRGEDTYPRRSTEIELERQSWLREKIYDTIPNSKKLFMETSIISYPITEHDGVSKLVEKYNEWIPEPIYKDKDGEPHWLEVQADLLARFQQEFGLEIYLSHENILEGEVWEIMDDYIEDGKLMVDKLPEEHKEWEVFSGFNHALRRTNKYEMLNEAKKLGFDDLLYYTWTCWWPVDDKPCNKCKLCRQRIIECRSLGDTT